MAATTAVTPVVAGQSSAAIASARVIACFMMGLTLKQPSQVSQAFKNVFLCNTVHELKCLQIKRVVFLNLHSNFNRTRNLVMEFDFTSESRQKQTRTNLRDLMIFGTDHRSSQTGHDLTSPQSLAWLWQ